MDDAGGRFKLSLRPSSAFSAELSGNLTYSFQNGYPYGVDNDSENRPVVEYNEKSRYKQLVGTTGLMLRYTTESLLLTSTTSYQGLKDFQGIDQDFLSDSIYFVMQDMRQNLVSEEITLRSNAASNYQWVIGTFGFYQAIRKIVDMDYRRLNYTTDKHYSTNTRGIAVYHQSSYKNLLIDGLTVGVGIRLDLESASQQFVPYKIDAAGITPQQPYDSELNFTEWIPKCYISYDPTPTQTFYGSVAKGYKTGGFNDSFQKEPDRIFDPENSWNYETGYKCALWNQAIKIDFALFYIHWKNQQVQYLDPEYNPPIPIIKNSGISQSKGLELSVSANPIKRLEIDLQYGYTHAVFTRYKKDENTDYSGHFIPYIPKNTCSLTGIYTLTSHAGLCDRITLMGQYNGIGSMYWEETNQYKQNYYSLINAQITFFKGSQSLSVWGRNVFNSHYNTYLFYSAGNRFCQQGKPASFGIDLTIHL
ncbi:MAG: TonB-dependent receptor [Dysgonamonadaceae bacterium]|nr:TonB-dependent receptor [Dysgonamonadaceae bacterium]